MMRLEGASIGLQLGGSATDFVMLVMNRRGANGILSSKVKLGADATAAAGPKGRTTEVATDATMSAEILSYSRSKGLIAGISLKGSTLRPDNNGNKDLYGKKVTAREIALEGAVAVPDAGQALIGLLQKQSQKSVELINTIGGQGFSLSDSLTRPPIESPCWGEKAALTRGDTYFALSAYFAFADKSQTGKVGLLRSIRL